jgi:hypothetical protein
MKKVKYTIKRNYRDLIPDEEVTGDLVKDLKTAKKGTLNKFKGILKSFFKK